MNTPITDEQLEHQSRECGTVNLVPVGVARELELKAHKWEEANKVLAATCDTMEKALNSLSEAYNMTVARKWELEDELERRAEVLRDCGAMER